MTFIRNIRVTELTFKKGLVSTFTVSEKIAAEYGQMTPLPEHNKIQPIVNSVQV